MQNDLRVNHPDLDITMFGVNEVGFEASNDVAADTRDIGLLQDTEDAAVWTTWSPVYRDVIVLGPDNTVVGVYNLTENNLQVTENYDTLKQMFIDAAGAE